MWKWAGDKLAPRVWPVWVPITHRRTWTFQQPLKLCCFVQPALWSIPPIYFTTAGGPWENSTQCLFSVCRCTLGCSSSSQKKHKNHTLKNQEQQPMLISLANCFFSHHFFKSFSPFPNSASDFPKGNSARCLFLLHSRFLNRVYSAT